MEKKTLSPAGRRRKGHSFERLISSLLRVLYPEAERAPQYTKGRPDVDGTPFWIECKRLATVTYGKISAAVRQAESDAYEAKDSRPVWVVTKQDRGDIMVHTTLKHLMASIERVHEAARKTTDE